MKCPACKYEDGWVAEKLEAVDGEHGEFFQLPIQVERGDSFDTERRNVYACPNPECGVLFAP